MSSNSEILTEWLRSAHAMEEQAKQMLSAQAGRIENYPDLSARIERHLQETERHEERLKALLDSRGGTSTVKDIGGKATAMFQGLAGSVAADEVVKGASASFAFENFEIAAYRTVIAAAKACGDTEAADVAESILREEEEMASWLADHIPNIAETYLAREAQGDTAGSKH